MNYYSKLILTAVGVICVAVPITAGLDLDTWGTALLTFGIYLLAVPKGQ